MREKVCKLTKVTLFFKLSCYLSNTVPGKGRARRSRRKKKAHCLQHHCYETRLKLIKLYNMVNSLSVLKIPPYFSNITYLTCHHHPLHFEFHFSKTDNYKFCNFTRTICDWNNLPIDSIESQDQMWLSLGKPVLSRNVGFKYSRCCSLPMVVQ